MLRFFKAIYGGEGREEDRLLMEMGGSLWSFPPEDYPNGEEPEHAFWHSANMW